MRFYRLSELNLDPEFPKFRNQSWLALFWSAVVIGGIALFLAIPRDEPTNPALITLPALFAAFLGALAFRRFLICRGKHGWLLCQAPHGLYVNLRSYRNHHLPEQERAVLFIPSEEVGAICKTHEIRRVPDRRRETVDQFSYIEIFLKEAGSLDAVRAALREERLCTASPGYFRRAKCDEYPVRVIEPAGIRLVWEWIKPNENRALDLLGAQYPVAPDRKLEGRRWDSLTDEEKEAEIRYYWEIGQVEDAMRLARMHWQIGETLARKKLQELTEA